MNVRRGKNEEFEPLMKMMSTDKKPIQIRSETKPEHLCSSSLSVVKKYGANNACEPSYFESAAFRRSQGGKS